MIYDLKNHTICENWGTVIATFEKEVLAAKAFEIVDAINNGSRIEDLEDKIVEYRNEISSLEDEISSLEDDIQDSKYLKKEISDLNDTIEERDQTIMLLDEKVDKLEAQLKDIEEYGTKEINEAVELRQELAELRVKYDQLYSDTEGK